MLPARGDGGGVRARQRRRPDALHRLLAGGAPGRVAAGDDARSRRAARDRDQGPDAVRPARPTCAWTATWSTTSRRCWRRSVTERRSAASGDGGGEGRARAPSAALTAPRRAARPSGARDACAAKILGVASPASRPARRESVCSSSRGQLGCQRLERRSDLEGGLCGASLVEVEPCSQGQVLAGVDPAPVAEDPRQLLLRAEHARACAGAHLERQVVGLDSSVPRRAPSPVP